MILVVIMYLGPGIGESVSQAVPINESGDFAGATNGADIWSAGTSLFVVVITIVVLSVALKSIFKLRGNQ